MSEITGFNINGQEYDISSNAVVDSSNNVLVYDDNSTANLNIGDENGNVLVQFKDGHIKTQNFNSNNLTGDKDYCAPFSVDDAYNNFKTPLFDCHRGVQSLGPENSLYSFKGGGTEGTWAIETDFHITSDEIVVCMHDNTINRIIINIDGSSILESVSV